MATDQNIPQEAAANRPCDLLLRFYREIGISAVAAALDATAGLPSAIAAKLVFPSGAVVAIAGDGGFMMNSQELETAMRLKLRNAWRRPVCM